MGLFVGLFLFILMRKLLKQSGKFRVRISLNIDFLPFCFFLQELLDLFSMSLNFLFTFSMFNLLFNLLRFFFILVRIFVIVWDIHILGFFPQLILFFCFYFVNYISSSLWIFYTFILKAPQINFQIKITLRSVVCWVWIILFLRIVG